MSIIGREIDAGFPLRRRRDVRYSKIMRGEEWVTFEESTGLTVIDGRPSVMPTYHRHQEIELNFLPQGSMTYLFAGVQRTVPTGRLAVFWAAFPHRLIHTEGDPTFYCFYLPLARLLQWRIPGELTTAILNGALVIDQDDSNILIDQVLLPRWADELADCNPAREKTCYLEMEARMRRLSVALQTHTPLSRDAERVNGLASTANEMEKVERITAIIAAHYTDPLGVSDIAALVGLHPKYAMTLFKKNFGMSILEYLTRHRLSHAQRLLATTNAKIVDIAFDAGFGSASRFYEIFERECGQSPREFRRRMQFGE
ncbi:helix-turn-helix domain-containing protein [Capsulimonas corticalis]|nr:helix-turn-helix domain-containing protein [Capsulimonas corticalis]